jgi:hypothetical protein
MRLSRSAALVAAALLSGSSAAGAQTKLIKAPYRFMVVLPMEAGSKTVTKGTLAFDFPLRWQSAAVLPTNIEVTADDRHQTLKQGQALVQTRLQFSDPALASAKSFCAPRLADPERGIAGILLGGMIARSLTDGQFCIIDRDGDGVAEMSVLVNAGSPAAREPKPITPVAYTLTPAAIVSEGDSARLLYHGGKSFEFQVIEQGHARRFTSFTYRDRNGSHTFSNFLRPQKLSEGVYRIDAPGLSFTLAGYDNSTGTAKIEWPATSSPAVVPIPDDVAVTVRMY